MTCRNRTLPAHTPLPFSHWSVNVSATGAGSGDAARRLGDGISLAPLYFNRALVHACLGDDASALDDLNRAVARETRNITYVCTSTIVNCDEIDRVWFGTDSHGHDTMCSSCLIDTRGASIMPQ